MIRSYFGLLRSPFDAESVTLLPHQQEVFDILRVHAQQGGLCLVLGEPGTGKSVLKQALLNHDPKRLITPVVNRTLHTYHNTLRILCQAFQIEFEGQPLDQVRQVGCQFPFVFFKRDLIHSRRCRLAQLVKTTPQVVLVQQPIQSAESRLLVSSRPVRYPPQ
jgi:energy-coupling factor transporter ATP-binding protein EcfA2